MYEKKRTIIQYDNGKEEIGDWSGTWKPVIKSVSIGKKQRPDCPYKFEAVYETDAGEILAHDEPRRTELVKKLQTEIDAILKLIHDLQEE